MCYKTEGGDRFRGRNDYGDGEICGWRLREGFVEEVPSVKGIE